MRLSSLLPLSVLALLAAPAPASAHPHIFVDATATIVFDDSGAVVGIRNAWTFDEAFSVWQIQGLDTNNDGITSSEEMQELADDNMSGLAEYQYYTFAGEGPDNLSFTNGRNATFTYENGRSTLRFDVDLESPYHIRDRLEIAINDPEYYVAISFATSGAVTLENAPAGCSTDMQAGHDMPDEIAAQLSALPPEVTELPPELANALRGVQGAILVECPATDTAAASTPLQAVTEVAQAKPAMPFGGPPPEPSLTMPRSGVLGWIAQQQKDFYQALTAALGRLKTDNTAFLVLGGLSFLYGIFHAAGPGHGKVVISSYVLANEQQVRRGVLLSFAAAMLQSAVAVLFVVVAAWALNMTALAMDDAVNWIGILSYALVALLGLWLVFRKLFGLGHHHHHETASDLAAKARGHLHDDGPGRALGRELQPALASGAPREISAAAFDLHGRRPGDPHYGHDHAGRDDHAGREEHTHLHVVPADRLGGDWREQLGVVLAVGLRPCSGALVVLVFALSQGLLAAGIAAVFLMGLGTAITVTILATLAVSAKGLARRLAGARAGLATTIIWWAELFGAAAVFVLGMLLLLASL